MSIVPSVHSADPSSQMALPTLIVMSAQPRRGQLVVVEGLDRSGKSSQCQLLVEALKKAGNTARYVKFPGRDFEQSIVFVTHGT